MTPRLAIAACLFWALLLGAAISLWFDSDKFDPEFYPLLGWPSGMIVATIVTALISRRLRYPAIILAPATLLAAFAGMEWLGVWGAGV